MVRWITENYKEVEHWTDITETIVNQYLLSLPASNREITRKVYINSLYLQKENDAFLLFP